MRLRIIKSMKGEIDGIPLAHFEIGETYDVGTTLGSYLFSLRAAVPVIEERPARVIPPHLPAGSAKAADRKRKLRPRKTGRKQR